MQMISNLTIASNRVRDLFYVKMLLPSNRIRDLFYMKKIRQLMFARRVDLNEAGVRKA